METATTTTRRAAMQNTMTAVALLFSPTQSHAVDDDLTRGGVQLTPFNGLQFNYRGNDFGGLDATTLPPGEPSVSYAEFLARLDKGEVSFVEFMAPDGDEAYATFQTKGDGGEAATVVKEKPIRIGEGYPVEDHGGWSSPAFVVKSVAKKGVPYKFTVRALAQYK